MKKISLLIAFVAFFSAASYATNTKDVTVGTFSSFLNLSNLDTDPNSNSGPGKTLPNTQSCTVTATWVNSTGQKYLVTVVSTCSNCTVQQACDRAYQTLSTVIPD
jgi:hypothetical protein